MEEIKKPTNFLYFTEIFRAIYQYFQGFIFLIKTKKNLNKSQETIVIIPGLLSGDLYTYFFKKFLQKQGYNAIGWGIGLNLGRKKSLEILIKKIEKIALEKQEKIILIGWSMGGIFAREVAKTLPNSIEKLFILAGPFANLEAPNNARKIYDFLNKNEPIDPSFLAQIPKPAPVETYAFYSKTEWHSVVASLHGN